MAAKRGGEWVHVSLDHPKAMSCRDSRLDTEIERTQLFEEVEDFLLAQRSNFKGRRLIALDAILRWLRSGCLAESWKELITESEIGEFLPRDGSYPSDPDAFIDHALRRTLDEVRRILRRSRPPELGGFDFLNA